MSLLSEEQVLDLTAAIIETHGTIYTRIKKWNEKQLLVKFLPDQIIDWDSAPEKAVQAVMNSYWVDGDGNTFSAHIQHYRRPVTPHPHAALMKKYAEVAARRVDPWVEFEYRISTSDKWEKLISNISFIIDFEYRYSGEDK